MKKATNQQFKEAIQKLLAKHKDDVAKVLFYEFFEKKNLAALKLALEYGIGPPIQEVSHSGDVTIHVVEH